VLTLTGSTSRADLADFAYRPDFIVESIADLLTLTHLSVEHLQYAGSQALDRIEAVA